MKRWLLIVVFVYCAPASAGAQQGTLLLSELLYQPVSGEAEYLELYNPGDTTIELSDFHIVRWVGDSMGRHYPLPQHSLPPHGYVALSKEPASVRACFRVETGASLLECNLPAYPNGGGTVVLTTADSLPVDRFDYAPSMHSRLLRDKAGVSLERRRFDRPTNEPSNWFSASSTCGYGTPGSANSQSSELLVEETAFELSSTLISPDGDDYQDFISIEYHMDDASLAARAEIYDARGRKVRRLMNDELLGAAGRIVWDGLGDNQQRLPQGQYVLQIIVYDTGGTRQTLRRTVALVTGR